jgi:hypothetical protein
VSESVCVKERVCVKRVDLLQVVQIRKETVRERLNVVVVEEDLAVL